MIYSNNVVERNTPRGVKQGKARGQSQFWGSYTGRQDFKYFRDFKIFKLNFRDFRDFKDLKYSSGFRPDFKEFRLCVRNFSD